MSDSRPAIAIMTSGGDAPGMNAAIQGAYCTASDRGMRVLGIRNGFSGLLRNDFYQLQDEDVKNIIRTGGTILGTSRCEEFHQLEVQQKAADLCRQQNIKAVIVIGGDGSYRGAQKLAAQGIGVIGVPATIDLDIGCTDYTIGFDTAVNSAMESIDKIQDTCRAHSCCSVIEVMGRNAGYLALWCGIANTAKNILIPEKQDDGQFIEYLKKIHFTSGTIVVAEGAASAEALAKKLEEELHIHTRANVLGFLQRGGSPSCRDRVCGCAMGSYAADLIADDCLCHAVCRKNGSLTGVALEEALAQTKTIPEELFRLQKILGKM